MAASAPVLQLGWLQEAWPAKVPVNLKGEGLTAHTAVIAQSGSGKSFMLGRLLEEIVSKTEARVLILDPNSDFVKFGHVEPNAWERQGLRDLFGPEDTRAAFERRWTRVKFNVFTERNPSVLGPQTANFQTQKVSVGWAELSLAEKAKLLGLSARTDPDEMHVLRVLDEAGKHPDAPGRYDLQKWLEVLDAILFDKHVGKIAGQPWPRAYTHFLSLDEMADPTVQAVSGRLLDQTQLGLWDRTYPPDYPRSQVASLADCDSELDVVTLDLGSLGKPEVRFLAAGLALDALWERARAAWITAMSSPAEEDARRPVFVVIDEAHNIAPAEGVPASAGPVIDVLVRIAMEGRKYGLFLILVTQRPGRVNTNLLSQCDNLCLMKMSNPADVELVGERFGFVPSGWAERALGFKKGEVLLSGLFVERPVVAKVAPRRTVEGGRSLRDEVWLSDPFPPEQGGAESSSR
jgi:hypothetical protein